jgi:hypothetical protein
MTPFRVRTATSGADVDHHDDWSRYCLLVAYMVEPVRAPSSVAGMIVNRARYVGDEDGRATFDTTTTEKTETLAAWSARHDMRLA